MPINKNNNVFNNIALYRGTIPVLCIVGPRVSLQYLGLTLYKPIFEKLEGKMIPSHSSAGLAGVSFEAQIKTDFYIRLIKLTFLVGNLAQIRYVLASHKQLR